MSNRKVRVRFAPSPTGPLHMGGVRTALYNYLFAKKNGGDFVLRLEDTDQTRFVAGAENYIIESLKWCGIAPNEGVGFGGDKGPYRQSERKPMYKQYVDQLIDSGHAYYAFDTAEELEAMREKARQAKMPNWQYNSITRNSMKNALTLSSDEVAARLTNGEPYTVRIKMPRNEEVRFHDLIRGWVVVNTANLDDKVLFKSDGMPTYHMANIVDDHLMEITHVIRGEEWLPSAPLHVLLYRFMGWEETMPQFAHLPLILKPDPSSFITKKTKGQFIELFAKEISEKEDQDYAEVLKVVEAVLANPKALQDALRVKDNDSGQKKLVKETLKKTLYGKLSKRDGDRLGFPVFPIDWNNPEKNETASGYREAGYFPDAFVNMMAFLGWNPGTPQEIFNLDELVNAFTLERVGKSGAKFDPEKTRWFNQQYLRSKPNNELAQLMKPFTPSEVAESYLEAVAGMMKERAVFPKELAEGDYFFEAPRQYDEHTLEKKWKEETPSVMQQLIEQLEEVDDFTAENVERHFKALLEQNNLGMGAVLPNFRLLVTGQGMGPSMFQIAAVLGKEETISRMKEGLKNIR